MTAIKKDSGKVRMDLLSEVAIEGLARVLTFGAEKYAEDNWRKGLAWRRCIGAALRHITEFMKGNDIDPESGLPHIDHAMCCLMFLSEYQKLGTGTDDRWKHLRVRETPLPGGPDPRVCNHLGGCKPFCQMLGGG